MIQIQHFFPGGRSDIHYHDCSTRIRKRLAPLMRHGSLDLSGWQQVPDSNYEFRLRLFQGTECLVFKSGCSYSYISVFRLPNELPDPLMKLVAGFYEKHEIGAPSQPSHALWIHSFPVYGSKPRPADLSWMHEIILLVYYTKLDQWMSEGPDPKIRYLSAHLAVISDGRQSLPKAQ